MNDPKAIRKWPAYLIVGLMAVILVGLQIADTGHRQWNVMLTMITLVVGLLLLALWALAFSRLPGRSRLKIAGGVALALVILFSTIRIQGVSGDLVPILSWRWSEQPFGTVAARDIAVDAQVADFPQFLGPGRNAKVPGVALADWSTTPPKERWRITVGQGWSAFAVSGRTAVTQEQRDQEECVVAYDVLTGEQKWLHGDTARYETTIAGAGPRATPTIDGNRVYTVGATGMLNCLDLASGDRIWSRNILEENDARMPVWGLAGSPLILGDLVVVSPGGPEGRSLVAYGKADGAFVWGGGSKRAGYSSPSIHTVAGQDQLLIFNHGSIAGHDPTDGRVLWQVPWEMPGGNQCVAQPLPIADDRVFVSTGYGIGCKLYELTPQADTMAVSIVYATPRMKAKFTNVVLHEGYIYGLDDGVLVCLDPANGQRKWKRGRYGHGQILLAGDHLIVQAEDGDLVLLEPRPDAHVELARIPALDGKTWNNPALAGSLLIVRNDREAVCFEVELKGGV